MKRTAMKRTVIFIVGVLLFCGWHFYLHLIAQTGEAENSVAPVKPVSLLDPKIEECSERELLELKVAAYRKLADYAADAAVIGAPAGRVAQLADAHADLAAAEIELYRHTGDQNKLRIALKARVEALSDKLRGVTLGYEVESLPASAVREAEVQLLDALLEQKRAAGIWKGWHDVKKNDEE